MLHSPVEVVTPPSAEPVTLAELKKHLRHQYGTAEDEELAEYLAAARQRFEFETGRAVLPTAFRQWYAGFWAGTRLPLHRGRATAVTQVRYYEPGGTLTTLTGWAADLLGSPQVVYLPPGVSAPALEPGRPYPVSVEFTAGWPNPAAVPVGVKVAIKQLAGHFYLYRETYRDSAFELRALPLGFQAACEQWAATRAVGGIS